MPELVLSSGAVHYTDKGQGSPILLLHANPGDSRDFAGVIEALAGYGRVLALDWPGYGQSPLPSHPEQLTVMTVYRVLEEFVQALALTDLVIVGNSLGGNAAVRLAAACPERVQGLVLVAPGGFTPHNLITRLFCLWQGSPLALSPYRFARLYLKRNNPLTQAMLARARSEQAKAGQLAMNRSLWRSFGSTENDLRTLAASVKTPALLLFGRHDPVIDAGKDGPVAQQCLPQARLEVLPCGHASFAEVPDLFLQQVESFLAGVLPKQVKADKVAHLSEES